MDPENLFDLEHRAIPARIAVQNPSRARNRGKYPLSFRSSTEKGSHQREVSRRNRRKFSLAIGRERQAGLDVIRLQFGEVA